MFRVELRYGPGRRGELLLCGHHARVSRAALARRRAAVFDAGGRLVASYPLEEASPAAETTTRPHRLSCAGPLPR